MRSKYFKIGSLDDLPELNCESHGGDPDNLRYPEMAYGCRVFSSFSVCYLVFLDGYIVNLDPQKLGFRVHENLYRAS